MMDDRSMDTAMEESNSSSGVVKPGENTKVLQEHHGGGGGGLLNHQRIGGDISMDDDRDSLSNNNNNNNNNEWGEDEGMRNGERRIFGGRSMDDGGIGFSRRESNTGGGDKRERSCGSPVTAIVGLALNQMNLKRSSSAPMINQLGIAGPLPTVSSASTTSTTGPGGSSSGGGGGGSGSSHHLHHRESSSSSNMGGEDSSASAFASSFLSSLGGPRPRRFSASFSPGSPGPAPNRVSQLRQENIIDWEASSEKEYNGTVNIAQSWEDLSLESMSMDVGSRRPSISDQLWLSMPASSAPSSPAGSPRVISRFSPSLTSPSPTRKSFTTRRSLSPIAVRPSVLTGVKRKCDWDSGSQMDCSPQPAKRPGGLLTFNSSSPGHSGGSPLSHQHPQNPGGYPFNYSSSSTIQSQYFNSPNSSNSPSPFASNPNATNSSGGGGGVSSSNNSLMPMMTMITSSSSNHHVEDSPFSNETESSISSIGGCDSDSPFFRPVDSPLASVTTSPEDSPRPISHPKI